MPGLLVLIAAISGFLAVALGAFGAHALRRRISAENIAIFQTGVQYQMYHSLAILAVALIRYWSTPSSWMTYAAWCFIIGIILFSGSLYLLSTTGKKVFGPITPLGGLAFLAGWVFLAIGSANVM